MTTKRRPRGPRLPPKHRLTNVMQLRLTADQHAALDLAAAEDGETLSEVARNAVVAYLHRRYPERELLVPDETP